MILKSNGRCLSLRILGFLLIISALTFPLFSQEEQEPAFQETMAQEEQKETQNNEVLQNILSEAAGRLAIRDFDTALELFEKLPPEEAGKTQVLLLRANILNSAGKIADAKKIANDILAEESENTDALMLLADAAALEGKDRDRRRFLESVIKIDPVNTRALNDLGNINLGNRRLKVAASYFDKALASDPNNGEALVGRASVHRYNGELRNAEKLLDRAIHYNRDWARPLHERARLFKSGGFLNDALEDLQAACELEPNNYWLHTDMGLVLMDLGRKQEALEEFSRAIEIEPNNFLSFVYSAGLKEDLGDFSGAERDYAKLAKLRPDYYFAYEGLGLLKMKSKQWAQARDAFLEAYKQAPREYSYALLASINWMRAGKQTDPKQFLAQVLRTASRDSIEYSMLRLFHDLNGDADVSIKIQNEQDVFVKMRMLFFLASWYDIRGNTQLANRFFLLAQETDNTPSIERRLTEWIIAERNIGKKAE